MWNVIKISLHPNLQRSFQDKVVNFESHRTFKFLIKQHFVEPHAAPDSVLKPRLFGYTDWSS